MDAETVSMLRKDMEDNGVVVISNFHTPGRSELISLGFSNLDIPELRMCIPEIPSLATALFSSIITRWQEGHVHSSKAFSLEGLVPVECKYNLYIVELVVPSTLGGITNSHDVIFPGNFRVFNILFLDATGKIINDTPRSVKTAYHH